MKTTTFKLGVVGGIIAILLVSITIPPQRAQAATTAELMAQIQNLLTQVTSLQNQLLALQAGGGTCTAPLSDIAFGSRGADVTTLQNFLISRGYTIPAGATGYFGTQTQTALRQFQAAQGISPALGNNYGPQTRARVQSICAPAPTPTPQPQPTPQPTPQPEPEPPLSGEASLERFAAKDGDDTDLEEGDKNAEIMEITFRVEDGDVKLNRLDLGFRPDTGNNENDPWDVFSNVSVWHGSKKIAEVDAGDEDEWREDSPTSGDYLLRLSGLSYILREGREVTLTVKTTIMRSVKGTIDGEIWNVFVPDNGLRGLDADNAAVYTGDSADSVTLNLDQAGASDELLVRRSDKDPDASTLQLKDGARSGYLEVFAFDLDTDDSKNDIDIRRLPISLTVSDATLNTFMRDIRLVVDGKTYTRETTVDGGTGVVTFEFDRGELQIDAGDRVTAVVEIDFNALSASHEGVSIVGRVEADDIEAEGEDDLNTTQLQGAATGETHFLYTKGTDAASDGTSAIVTSTNGSANDYVAFTISFNLTAFGQDVYIPVGLSGVDYRLEDAVGAALSASGTVAVTSDAREKDGYFHIPEGSTKNMRLMVTYQPGVPGTTARLQLLGVHFNDTPNTADQFWSALPSVKYRTQAVIIVD